MERQIIKDKVLGSVVFDDETIDLQKLIETKEFKRLFDVNQSPFLKYFISSASVSRHAHSLGAYEIARRWLQQKKIFDFTNKAERREVYAAALLHDIGHGPFSHSFETICHGNYEHEEMSIKIITDSNSEVNKVLKELKIKPEKVAAIIKHDLTKIKRWQAQMVSSQIDVDRLDYFNRDGDSFGFSYGRIDIDLIFNYSRFKEINGEEVIVFDKRIDSTITSFLIGRFLNYRYIYENKDEQVILFLIRSIIGKIKKLWKQKKLPDEIANSFIFQKIFKIIFECKEKDNLVKKIDVEIFRYFDDHLLMSFLKSVDWYIKDKEIQKWTNSLFGKNIFRYERIDKLKKDPQWKYIETPPVKVVDIYNEWEPIYIDDGGEITDILDIRKKEFDGFKLGVEEYGIFERVKKE